MAFGAQTWIQILAPSPISYVTEGQLLHWKGPKASQPADSESRPPGYTRVLNSGTRPPGVKSWPLSSLNFSLPGYIYL